MESIRQRRERGLLLLLLLLWTAMLTISGEQHFGEKPTDQIVLKGQTALLKCVIRDLAGDVQWLKNGFGLGFDRDIPGHPRYSMIGDASTGEYNLLIRDTVLSDDDPFSCQVGPRPGHPALSASAYLHINIAPPKAEILDYANGSLVEVPYEQKTVNLTCVARAAKPAATIKWFKNGEEITEDIQYSVEDGTGKLKDATSVLKVTAERSDNGALFTCQAFNNASETPKETIVELSVMHPPNPPEITGYETGKEIKINMSVHLSCVVRGGNPLAQTHWYKNGQVVDFSYNTGNGKSVNDLFLTVQPNDNNAVYQCKASNRVTPTPLTAQVVFTVYFGPARMTITGHEHAKAGENITLTCTSDISNPPTKISWYGQGRPVLPSSMEETPSPKGGFVTTSNITVTLPFRQESLLYSCQGYNEQTGHTESATINVAIMYPPEPPIISGYRDGKEVEADKALSLSCSSHGGNPEPTLTWWKGDTLLPSEMLVNRRIVSSQITFLLKREDNQAKYTCNATNSATDKPLLASVTLTVNYPPKSLIISTDPPKPKAGQPMTLTCRSDASNPECQLTWWKDDKEVPGDHLETVEAEYGGKATISQIRLTPTAADHDQFYECRATNDLLTKAVIDGLSLDISFKPMFPAAAPSTFVLVEGSSGILNLTATGNPTPISYVWYKGDSQISFEAKKSKRDVTIPHFVADGGVLNITDVSRKDSGQYTCEGSNAEGATNFTVHLDVHYPATIYNITESVNVDHNSEAVLECKVDANPMPAVVVTWSRPGYNLSDTVQTHGPGFSKLTVRNVSKEDSGTFTCTASNKVKDADSKELKLVVKYAPEIDRSDRYSKAAARHLETASLICKAEGAPAVTFTWFKACDSQDKKNELDVTGIKYHEETKEEGIVHSTSTLQVFNVTLQDYGCFTCKASNELGIDQFKIHLDNTSEPFLPTDLTIVNATHNSIALSWIPGFNGGAPQRFRIRYRRVGTESHKTEEVTPGDATVYLVTGLRRSTEYEFSIQAENVYGRSKFLEEYVKGKTTLEPKALAHRDDVPLIIILTVSIFGMLLLGLNILLILFFYRRRRKKLEKDASEGTSNANTVEMFTAPTITEDSKSYTTFDRRSLEDFPDEYRAYDPDDELKRFLPPPTYSSTDLYRPHSTNVYGPAPHLGSAPHLGPTSHLGLPHHTPSPAFGSQHSFPHTWDSRKPDPYGSVPRMRAPSPPEDSEEYANQLRALQRGVTSGPTLPPNGTLPRDDRRRHDDKMPPPSRAPPPLPPTRSSSRVPPGGEGARAPPPVLPSRNYGPDDIQQLPPGSAPTPRYAPPPGFDLPPATRPSNSGPASRPASRPSSRPQSQYDYDSMPINYPPATPPYRPPPPPRPATPPGEATPLYQAPPTRRAPPPPPPKPQLRGEFV